MAVVVGREDQRRRVLVLRGAEVREAVEPGDLRVGNDLDEQAQWSGLEQSAHGPRRGLPGPRSLVVGLEPRRQFRHGDASGHLGGSVGEADGSDGSLGARPHAAAACPDGASGESHLAQRL